MLPAYAFRGAASINYVTTLLPSRNFPRLQNFTKQTYPDAQTPNVMSLLDSEVRETNADLVVLR